MINLDPDPTNVLGKGILDPAEEARLIAEGCVYAVRRTMPDGHAYLSCSFRSREIDIKRFMQSLVKPTMRLKR